VSLSALAADAAAGPTTGEVMTVRVTAGVPSTVELPCTVGMVFRTRIEPDVQLLVIQLRDPAGELLAEVRSPVDMDEPDDPLPLAAVPTRSGTCTLTVTLSTGPPGEVVLRVEPLRAPTPTDEIRIRAERLHQRAVVLWADGSEGALREAVELDARAAALSREAGDVRGESDAHAVAASILWQLGEMETGHAEMSKAVELRKQLGDPRALAMAYNDRGLFQEDLGNSVGALEDLERARELAAPLPRPGLQALILHNIAFTHQGLKEYERALELYRESQRLAERCRTPPRFWTSTIDTIGMVLLELRRYDEAEEQFRRALEERRATGDRRAQAITLTHLGWVYGDTRRLTEAERAHREAIVLLEVTGDRFNLAFARDGLGEVLLLQGRAEEATSEHRAALRLAQEAPDANQQAISLTNLATALRALGHLEEARDALVAAVDLTDAGRLVRPGGSGRTSWTARNHDRYERLVSVLWDLQQRSPDPARVAEMFWMSERGRARTLLDLLLEARVDVTGGSGTELLARERRLLDEAERVSAELARRTASGGRLSTEAPELRRVLAELEETRGLIRQSDPRLAALTRSDPLRLPAVQSQVLDRDTVLLEYLLGEDRSFLFIVTPGAIAVRALPARARIEREVHRLTRVWQSPESDPVSERRLASRLGGMLVEPALEQIRGKRLAIAADGALHELPFPALVLPRTQRRLVEDHEVVLLPSASALAALRAGAHPGRHMGTVAVLADPVFDRADRRLKGNASQAAVVPADLQRSMDALGLQRLARLPGTRREAELILALAPPGQSLAAMGFEARRALAMDPALSSYRILHFATHGLLNSTHPELSGLVLSLVDPAGEPQNGFLRLQDIYGMRIAADLVVLSACQTALGKQVQGEGVLGLTRGFIHAGARQVLASLWKVSDRGTAELMKEFYRRMLVEGQRPSAALRQAQRKLARTRPFDAPYTWAAFVLQGDWDEIPHPTAADVRR
jgi:CHAT domain-containing protein/tetratricopeptide (TPR) repeat protein